MHECPKVVHLTPHLNGGLGKVLLTQVRLFPATHEIYVYEQDKNSVSEEFRAYDKKITFGDINRLQDYDFSSKVTQVELWNHPLIYSLIISGYLDHCYTLIGCIHIQGTAPPQLITKPVLEYFDYLLTTGSWLQDYLNKKSQTSLAEKITDIQFPINEQFLTRIGSKRRSQINGLTVAYVGTVSYSKMSKDFLSICRSLPRNSKIIIVGPTDTSIIQEAQEEYPDLNISFLGRIECVDKVLEKTDIFLYPLRRGHYGTGELALVEAMAMGLPVVSFCNEAESRLIKDKVTGFICKDNNEMKRVLAELSENQDLRHQIGDAAKKDIRQSYSSHEFKEKLSLIYSDVIKEAKNLSSKKRNSYKAIENWQNKYKELCLEGFFCFIESLRSLDDSNKKIVNVLNQILKKLIKSEYSISEEESLTVCSFFNQHPGYSYDSKGGIGHYLYCFPKDRGLKLIYESVQSQNCTKDRF